MLSWECIFKVVPIETTSKNLEILHEPSRDCSGEVTARPCRVSGRIHVRGIPDEYDGGSYDLGPFILGFFERGVHAEIKTVSNCLAMSLCTLQHAHHSRDSA